MTTPAATSGSRLAGRSTALLLTLVVITIVLGLASRRLPSLFPSLVAIYGGDALWAALMVWLVALLRRHAATVHVASIAFTVCVIVECSQLYHAPWIDAIRATTGGALVLGHGFLWSDLVAYGCGVTIAAGIDWVLTHRHLGAPTSRS